MKFTTLFRNLVFTEPNQVKLTVTSDLAFLSEERRADIEALYKDSHPNLRLVASFMNALFTQKKTTFLFSRRIFQELLSGDSRSTRSTMSGDDQSEFMAWLLKNKIVRVLRESSNQAGPGAKSAVVEVIEPEMVSEIETLVGRDYLSAQKEATLKFYDDFEEMKSKRSKTQPSQKVTSTETSTDTVSVNVSVNLSTTTPCNDILDKDTRLSKEEKAKDNMVKKPDETASPLASSLTSAEFESLAQVKVIAEDAYAIEFLADIVDVPVETLTAKQIKLLEKLRKKANKGRKADTLRPVDLEEVKALEELEKKRDLRIKTFLAYTPEVQLREATAFLGTGYVKQMSSHESMVEVYIAEVRLWDGRYGC